MKSKTVLDPVAQTFLDQVNSQPGPKFHELTPQQARDAFKHLQTLVSVNKEPVDTEKHELPVGPNGKVSIRILRPPGTLGVLPVLVYVHGGGWVRGDYKMYERMLSALTNGSGAALIFVEFQRAPEGQYPIPIEEVYAVVQWIAENGSQLNLDVSRLAIAGESAGGNIAAAVTLLAKERKGPKIGFQLLLYPVTSATFTQASYQEFANGYFLSVEAIQCLWDFYCPDITIRNQPTASPLMATLDQLSGLPPTLIISAECDVTRDECEAYAHKLIEAEVPVLSVRFEATVHAFLMLDALAETQASRGAMALIFYKLRDFFEN
ncbi:alpha/beta hydrolase [Legionella sainthelensi]|uniref:Alpha/beta hydrolase n=1 Tax=Legionella sainthelensi TaxID=28087 RepID=A0A0W0YBV2_9GAMM|nr:alpha/beta hydrolase [Legionella sainthelensi]KTD54425.1 alpha/beta hydrolase [Legionella sainthelensi]VEH33233.1 alpha/beta hydrolase [Legionella sainthelensi]